VIDVGGGTVIPGLNDSHTHPIRGGLYYNLELRWDGVPSLSDALALLKEQARRTPPPHWVRVVGGWSAYQFKERRLPTLEEINAAAPDTPVFILHLYDRAWLNGAALRAVGYTKDTPEPPGGEIQRDKSGHPTGLLVARPNAWVLYATLAKGPKLSFDEQLNSSRRFMRELNRLGVTSVIDAGGGFQNYPDDYKVIRAGAAGQLTTRFAYHLFTQRPGELRDFSAGRDGEARQGTTSCGSTEPGRCWRTPRPTSRTSSSRGRTCPRTWSRTSRRWSRTWRRAAGRSASTPPTTRPSRGRSTSSNA
jgi:predicted amidohydrolase YtcJ